jgi:nicotinamidase-related amidase
MTLEDCCAAIDPALHAAAISLIYGENHLFGWVGTADGFLAALGGGTRPSGPPSIRH